MKKVVEHAELKYIPLSPKPNRECRRINEYPVKQEKKRHVESMAGIIATLLVIFAAGYMLCVMLSYGANWA